MRLTKDRLCLYSSLERGRSSAKTIIETAVGYGVGGVELMSFCDEMRIPDRKNARELCDMARSSGLRIPCFSVFADLYTSPDTERERLARYAEICAENSIPALHHTVDPSLSIHSMSIEDRTERFRLVSERLAHTVEYTHSLGVKTLIEDQGFVFNGADALESLVGTFGESFGILLDFGNILFVDESSTSLAQRLSGSVVHAHIKDYRVTGAPLDSRSYRTLGGRYLTDCEIGTGDVDVLATAEALERAGYRGMYSLEFAAPVSDAEARRVLNLLTGGEK